jgi:hypothetical protein
MENIFYVYIHRKADDGTVFYVGKGKGRRAFWKNGRNKHWHAVVSKHEYEVLFVAQFLTEAEAFQIERETIAYYGRANLCNYTDGGDGSSGSKRSAQFKELMRQKMLGRQFSAETIEKMRQAARERGPEFQDKRSAKLRGRKHTEAHKAKIALAGIGRKVSDETRAKLSAIHKGKKKKPDAVARMAASKSKAVFCFNNELTYQSISAAARELGLSQSKISDVCFGRAKHTKGYVFTRV